MKRLLGTGQNERALNIHPQRYIKPKEEKSKQFYFLLYRIQFGSHTSIVIYQPINYLRQITNRLSFI